MNSKFNRNVRREAVVVYFNILQRSLGASTEKLNKEGLCPAEIRTEWTQVSGLSAEL